MSTTVTLTLSNLTDEVLDQLYRLAERPFQTTVGSNALTALSSDVTLTLGDGANINVSDLLEIESELMLVTNKTTDPTPVFTVSRAYAGTSLAAHVEGTVVLKNPEFPRSRVKRYIERFFTGPANTYIPSITSASMIREPGLQWIEMPADTVRVLSVRFYGLLTGRVIDIAGWRFEEDIPTAITPTGKLLRIHSGIFDNDELIVTYQVPYSWSATPPVEGSTITAPLGAEDLPVLWTAAYLVTRREVTRLELDTVEEWNQEQATRLGVNLRQVRELWGEFYRRLDEVRKVQYVPKQGARPYRKMVKI